jgi:hypothetical protein
MKMKNIDKTEEEILQEKLEHKRELARIRSKRMYDKRKDEILKRRVELKEEKKYKSIDDFLNMIENPSTKKLYSNAINKLNDIIDCSNIMTCFENIDKVIESIEKAKMKNSEEYSGGTKLLFYRTILKIIDTLKLDINTTKYKYKFDYYNLSGRKETEENKQEKIINFTDYLKLLKNKFGENSKEYIIGSLYEFRAFRDDLQLKIIEKMKDAKDNKINYILVGEEDDNIKIILNNYKTVKKYKQDIITLNKKLTDLIIDYIDELDDLTYGDYLFGSSNLANFIIRMNKKIDLDLSINNLRQMYANKKDINAMNIDERLKLAKEMKHQPSTTEVYKRIIA